MRIELAIDRLRVLGAGALSGAELAALVEEELGRLVEEHGAPPGLVGGGTLSLDRRTIEIEPGSSPREIGAAVARRLFGELGGTGPDGA